ncbi:methylenetetrahydrofolate reductase [Diabrotica virgifera virgifera]|uniref:Methylenetetrahydrofolate reductase (NAD(P)H) n=1 Tax=Diabrotica virgifera virgifera TaxID=50390 RepID=A0ABM5KLB3_DIAVI|nr:methylenetetrahydrofolate reductase [Diabrotica virgifera virgifera]
MRETLINSLTKIPISIKPAFKKVSSDNFIKNVLTSDLRVSIEVCPNRALNEDLLSSIPFSFCSVTWRTPSNEQLEHVDQIPALILAKQLNSNGYNVLLHLAGRYLKREQVVRILEEVKSAGIRNLFALQGDPSEIKEKDDKKCDFPYASDLVTFIRERHGNYFCVGVAGYPEKHPQCENIEKDLQYLKFKVTRGADFIITQASYDYQRFLTFSQQCHLMGINVPIIPGVFIISSHRTLTAMSKFCGVTIPRNIIDAVEAVKGNDDDVAKFGVQHATELIGKIFENQHLFAGVHMFSLNNLELVKSVLQKTNINSECLVPLNA